MNFVFVYGSLKNGFHNHKVMKDSQFIGIATTKEKYDMFSYSSFPAVIPNGDYHIKGEIYYVDDETLKELDRLEGNGSFYKRKIIDTEKLKDIWCYFLLNYRESQVKEQTGIQIINGDTKVWVKKY